MKTSFLVLISALAAGCATERYGFRPAAVNPSSEAGYPASHYGVPPDAPRGDAYVTSFGTREISEGDGAQSQLIHVRLAIANQSSETWSVDPAQLTLVPATGGAPQRPDFMEIDGRQNGSTEIGHGQRRMFDVYYRMPGGARDARAVPSFDFEWQVNVGGKLVAEHTSFVREPYRDYEETGRGYVAVGVAAPWWWGWYGPPWWGIYGWPYGPFGYGRYGRYYGYGPGYYGGARYRGFTPGYGGGGVGRARVAPAIRGRGR